MVGESEARVRSRDRSLMLVRAWRNPEPSSAASDRARRMWMRAANGLGDALQWLRLRLLGPENKAAHLLTGERGEEIVYWHLQRMGWKILARRWRSPGEHGDIDLVAFDGEYLCFIEVKTRTSRGMIPAALAVDADKRRMLRQMARLYLRRQSKEKRPEKTRFDVVEVYLERDGNHAVHLHRDAFGWSDRRRRYRD